MAAIFDISMSIIGKVNLDIKYNFCFFCDNDCEKEKIGT